MNESAKDETLIRMGIKYGNSKNRAQTAPQGHTHRERQVAFARLLVLANQAIDDRVRLCDAFVIVHLHGVLLVHGKVDEAAVGAAEAEAPRRVASLRWARGRWRWCEKKGDRYEKNERGRSRSSEDGWQIRNTQREKVQRIDCRVKPKSDSTLRHPTTLTHSKQKTRKPPQFSRTVECCTSTSGSKRCSVTCSSGVGSSSHRYCPGISTSSGLSRDSTVDRRCSFTCVSERRSMREARCVFHTCGCGVVEGGGEESEGSIRRSR
jgi:hypothetical protein